MSADLEEAKAVEVKEDAEEGLKKDFQELRELITEEGGHTDVEEDDDDETCGFCRFMKAGGCKPEFTAWSACVDANRGEGHNFTEECADATLALQGCMEAHRDYYKDFMLDPDFNEPNKAEESGADAAAAPDAAPEAQGGSTEEGAAAPEESPESTPAAEEVEYTSAQKTIGNLEEEELPPPETVLSGLEGEFTKDSGGSPKEPEQAAAAEAKGAGDEEKAGGEQEGGEEKEHGEAEAKEEEPEEEEEEEEKPVIQVRTSAYDARFPSINQARHCYTRYNEYYRCVAERGDDAPECSVFQRAYRSLCPSEWVERWNEQREEGTWPGRY